MSAATSGARRILRGACAAVLVLSLLGGVAWAFWTTGAAPGSSGASAAATVRQASTPTVAVSGREVTVDWALTTLSNGEPVSGYQLQRFHADTLVPQPIGAGCTGTVTTTRCTESRVPPGRWVYAVTATVGTHWRGQPSAKSSVAIVAGPSLELSATRVRPGTTMTGTANGFLPGETLRYRLDSPTGPELSGTLAGNATPATVPASGGGAVNVSIPAGTSDGAHTVHAVTAPSGESASAPIVVDGTAPPAPVLTQAPTNPSGDTVTFAFTEAESSATVECRLDNEPFAPCQSPVDYAGLAEGSHVFEVRATDTVGNVSSVARHPWTVSLTIPVVAITFPRANGAYNDSGFAAGCGTPARDVCGTAEDDIGVSQVRVSLRQDSTGAYWNGLIFLGLVGEVWLGTSGTTDWSSGNLPSAGSMPEGSYTLRAEATDTAGNLDYDTRTFTIDRTAPPAPVFTKVPANPSGRTTSVEFTSTDPTATFECSLDSGPWSTCASPKPYADLTDGSHTVAVRAIDAAGNTSAATSTTWTVDANPPTGAMTFPTAGSYNQARWTGGCGTPAGDICGTAGDAGSGVTSVAVTIYRADTNTYWNGTSFAASSETWLNASGTASWSYPFAATSFPADGGYTVRWRVLDAAGNTTTGGADLTIDTTPPPAPQIVQAPADPSGSSVQFDFTVAAAQVTTECRLDAAAWTPCTAPVGYTGLPAGSHTFAVRATDAAGNTGPVTSHTWVVDTGLPGIGVGFPSGGRSYNDAGFAAGCGTPTGDLCGTASDPQGSVARVEVSIQREDTSMYWNGTAFASSTEVLLPATGTNSWSYAMAATAFPAEGQYTLRARATDGAGLTATDSVAFNIDRTAPAAPAITSGPTGTTRGNDTFAFSGEAGVTLECRLDTGVWQACTSPRTLSGLADGSHTFDVHAVDSAGNTSPATSRTWTVDATAPTSTTAFPSAGAAYNNTTFNAGCSTSAGDLCGSASDNGGSGVTKVEVSVQRGSTGLYLSGTTFGSASQNWLNATGTTSWSYPLAAATFPADDTYHLSVRVTDVVGNTRTTTSAFRIDRTKPTAVGVTTTNVGAVRKLEAGDTFTLTFSEPMAPGSIIAGWTGTAPQNVVVRAASGSTDKLTIYNAGNTTQLPLGTVDLRRSDFVSQAVTFGANTITMNGNSVTITLGTPNISNRVTTAAAAANLRWTPSATATDIAGNGATTTAFNESDSDSDF